MKKLPLIALFATLLCGCATHQEADPQPECLPDQSCCVAARVGDTILTREALDTAVAAAVNDHLALFDADEQSNIPPDELREGCRQEYLYTFAFNALVRAIARRNAITVTPEELTRLRAEYTDYATENEDLPEETLPDFEIALLTEKISERFITQTTDITDAEVNAEIAKRSLEIANLKEEFAYYRNAVTSGGMTFEAIVTANSDVKTPITVPDDEIEAALPPEIVTAIHTTPEGQYSDVIIDNGTIGLLKILRRIPAQADTGPMTEILVLTKSIPIATTDTDTIRDELASHRLETAYFTFMAEQIKAIGVTFPSDPDLENLFLHHIPLL